MPDQAEIPPPQGNGAPADGNNTNLPLPEKFHGSTGPQQTELWPKWERRFSRYRHASGLVNKSEREQVSTVLYAMGECADDILATMTLDEKKATYDELIDAFNEYFQVRKNIIADRAKFNKRKQQPGEPVEIFIQDLYKLVEDCKYGALKEELIRDNIVTGVLSDSLSDRLQSRPNLTLADAVQMCRQAEARHDNREVVRGDTKTSTTVNYVKKSATPRAPSNQHRRRGNFSNTATTTNRASNAQPTCKWCGRQRHDRSVCPARDVKCNNCSLRGHFGAVCLKPQVNEVDDFVDNDFVDDDLVDIDFPFLGEIADT